MDTECPEEETATTPPSKPDKDQERATNLETICFACKQSEEAGQLLDALHLQLLSLMEEHALLQVHLEIQTSRARMILTRTRLQQGFQRTSAVAHLPHLRPFRSLCRLVQQSRPWGMAMKLLRLEVDPQRGYVQPVTNFFGALVPISLRVASQKWEQCVNQVVDIVNVQRELQSVMNSIEKLRRALDKSR